MLGQQMYLHYLSMIKLQCRDLPRYYVPRARMCCHLSAGRVSSWRGTISPDQMPDRQAAESYRLSFVSKVYGNRAHSSICMKFLRLHQISILACSSHDSRGLISDSARMILRITCFTRGRLLSCWVLVFNLLYSDLISCLLMLHHIDHVSQPTNCECSPSHPYTKIRLA